MELRPGGPHREPDLMFVRTEHLDRWSSQRLHGPADLVFEVLSEDTAREDLGRKREQYAELGVPEYVLIDARPGRHEFAYLRLGDSGSYAPVAPDEHGRYHSTVLTGFWLDPTWFRQERLPSPMSLLRRISPGAWQRLVEEVEHEG